MSGENKKDQAEREEFWAKKVSYVLPIIPGQTSNDRTVTVTHNGINYQIKRGETVMIPRFLVEVLEESNRLELESYENQEKDAYSDSMA